jgi:hypothetical protein
VRLIVLLLCLSPQSSFVQGVREDLAVGVSISGSGTWSVEQAGAAGFGYMRHTLEWSSIDQSRGRLLCERDRPNHLNNVVGATTKGDLGLVFRLDGGPNSAGGAANQASSLNPDYSPQYAYDAVQSALHQGWAGWLGIQQESQLI